jgi:hypothetical protein
MKKIKFLAIIVFFLGFVYSCKKWIYTVKEFSGTVANARTGEAISNLPIQLYQVSSSGDTRGYLRKTLYTFVDGTFNLDEKVKADNDLIFHFDDDSAYTILPPFYSSSDRIVAKKKTNLSIRVLENGGAEIIFNFAGCISSDDIATVTFTHDLDRTNFIAPMYFFGCGTRTESVNHVPEGTYTYNSVSYRGGIKTEKSGTIVVEPGKKKNFVIDL